MEWFEEFKKMISDFVGFILPTGNQPHLERFIFSRAEKQGYKSVTDYLHVLKKLGPDSQESQKIINAVTNKKTLFYRAPGQFEKLREFITKIGKSGRKVKIWCAACSTGEEPYTLAMLASEENISIEILATDINTDAIHASQLAEYSELSLIRLPKNLSSKYLIKKEGSFKIIADLKHRVKFRRHNLMSRDFPRPSDGGKWDFILCRNVFIYFSYRTIDEVLKKFEKIIVPESYLFLGASESLYGISDVFNLEKLADNCFAYSIKAKEEAQILSQLDLNPTGIRDSRIITRDELQALLNEREQYEESKRIVDMCKQVERKPKNLKTTEIYEKLNFAETEKSSEVQSDKRIEFVKLLTTLDDIPLAGAISLLEKYLIDFPFDTIAIITFANLLLENKELAKALNYYYQSLDLSPLVPEVHFFIGLVHKRARAIYQAAQSFRRTLFLDDSFWTASFELAVLLERNGQKSEARREFSNTIEAVKKREVPLFQSYFPQMEDIESLQLEIEKVCLRKIQKLR